jgi:hypothetical protein
MPAQSLKHQTATREARKQIADASEKPQKPTLLAQQTQPRERQRKPKTQNRSQTTKKTYNDAAARAAVS